MDVSSESLQWGDREDYVVNLTKTLNKVENSQKLIKEEFRNQRKKLLRKNLALDAARATIDEEFVSLQVLIEELNVTTEKYACEQKKFMDATATFVNLQNGGNTMKIKNNECPVNDASCNCMVSISLDQCSGIS